MCQALGWVLENYRGDDQNVASALLELPVQWVYPDAEPGGPQAPTSCAECWQVLAWGQLSGEEGKHMAESILNSEGGQEKDGNGQSSGYFLGPILDIHVTCDRGGLWFF